MDWDCFLWNRAGLVEMMSGLVKGGTHFPLAESSKNRENRFKVICKEIGGKKKKIVFPQRV